LGFFDIQTPRYDLFPSPFCIQHSIFAFISLSKSLSVSYSPIQTDGSDAATSRRAAFALASPDNSSIVPARNAPGGQLSTHAGSCP
jgi:hypothetical protein